MGVVLAGGSSRRMGRDKLRLSDDSGTLLVGVALGALAGLSACGEVVVVGPAWVASADGVRSLADLEPGGGPLGGVIAAHRADPSATLLVVAGDLPAVTTSTLERVLDGFGVRGHQGVESHGGPPPGVEPGVEAVVGEQGGRRQVLIAAYRPGVLARLDTAWSAGERSLTRALRPVAGVRTVALSAEECRDIDTPEQAVGWT